MIAIIGILATVVIASLNSARGKARDAKRIADMKTYQTAIMMYIADGNVLPQNTAFSITSTYTGPLHTGLVGGGYLSSLPYEQFHSEGGAGNLYYLCTRVSEGSVCFEDNIAETWAIRFRLEDTSYMCINSQGIEPTDAAQPTKCIQR